MYRNQTRLKGGFMAGPAQAQSNPPELWSKSSRMGHDSRLQALAANARFLFAAGYKGYEPGKAGAPTCGVVRCYDAQTGELVWEKLFGEGSDGAHAYSLTLSASGKELFVTGGEPGSGGWVNLVMAYDAERGDLLWTALQEGRLVSSLHFKNILVAGDKLFTGCTIPGETGGYAWQLKAYLIPRVPGKAPGSRP
jgi:outer membrane protein assembly factor BamB